MPQQQGAGSSAVDWFTSRRWWLTFRNVLIAVGFVVIVLGAVVDITEFVESRRAGEPSIAGQPSALPITSVVNEIETAVTPSDDVLAGLVPIPDEFLDLLTNTYTVAKGDVLYEIAARHDTTTQALVDLNNIADPNRIEIGQVLALPG